MSAPVCIGGVGVLAVGKKRKDREGEGEQIAAVWQAYEEKKIGTIESRSVETSTVHHETSLSGISLSEAILPQKKSLAHTPPLLLTSPAEHSSCDSHGDDEITFSILL